jgi:uncharacterized protein
MTTLPIAEGLFTWPDVPRLIGGSCLGCGATTFPRQPACPRCTGTSIREVALAARGTLWSWTIQGFDPKGPYAGDGSFAPYGVGYVKLAALADGAAAVLVESRLTTADPGQLRIGDEMELVIMPFRHDSEGNELVTFAFRPAAQTA